MAQWEGIFPALQAGKTQDAVANTTHGSKASRAALGGVCVLLSPVLWGKKKMLRVVYRILASPSSWKEENRSVSKMFWRWLLHS